MLDLSARDRLIERFKEQTHTPDQLRSYEVALANMNNGACPKCWVQPSGDKHKAQPLLFANGKFKCPNAACDFAM